MNLKCLITDDEPIALEIMEDYISQVPGLMLAGKCKNAMETMSFLRKETIDVLFLDIQMPGINGIDYIRSVKNPPAVIMTTAFPQYAMDGYELDVVDYLLKPISFDRFLKAIDKLFNRNISASLPGSQESQPPKPTANYFFIRSNLDFIKVAYAEVLYIEGLENYVRIFCETQTITSLGTMKHMEEILPVQSFIRIHRSYIVNLEKVSGIYNYLFRIGNKEFNIGKSYRKAVLDRLKNYLK